MTFGEMKDAIADRLGDTNSDTKAIIGGFVNDLMFRISDELQYPGELKEGHIRTESGRFAYPLEPDVQQVLGPMTIPEENGTISMTSVETLDTFVQKPESTGTPISYIMLGSFGILRQPATKLLFSAQAKAIDATIYGMVDYLPTSEVLSLNQGDPTTTLKDFTKIDKITLSDTPSTTTTVLGNGAANNDVKVAQFTSSEKEALTSAYGLYNPGSKVIIKSSNAADLALRTVVVTGYGPLMSGTTVLQDNIYLEEEITSDGVTASSSTNRFTTIESVSIDAESAVAPPNQGIFSVTADPITTRRIVTLPFKKRSLDIPMVAFYPLPNGQTINYKYYRRLTPLTIDADRLPMDERVHYYIKKWADSAVLAWYGDNRGISDVIQNGSPQWQQDMQTLKSQLGLNSSPFFVIGGRAINISKGRGPTALLDPAYYSN
jgi:hypothetical protein